MSRRSCTLRWRPLWAWLGALACAGAPMAARSAAEPLDDSGTQVSQPVVTMQWSSSPADAGRQVHASVTVQLVLDTRRHAGRRARIYMKLAPLPVRVEVVWSGRGGLAPGRLEPGQRALLFDGVVPGPTINDRLQLQIGADGQELRTLQQLRFGYEIEVLP